MRHLEPTQGHVSMDTVTGALKVHWVSGDPSPGIVEYKAAGDSEWSVRHASVTTYDYEDMCNRDGDPKIYYDPGFFYTADLPASLEGEIRVRFGGIHHRSEIFTVTAPVPPSSDEPHSVALFGDMGVQGYYRGPDAVDVPSGSWDTYWVVDHMRSNTRLRMAVHIGDVSYAMGYARVWDLFGTALEGVAMRMPYMVSIGNHEFDYTSGGWHPSWGNFGSDSGGECGVPTKHRYQFPYWYYSFSFGLVHYVMLSSEHDWTEGSEQWEWLDEQLASVDRLVTPWLVVTAHRPMLVSAYDPPQRAVEEHMYPALGPLLKEHQVDLFVAGHWHYYERTHPVDGTVHVLAGSAGAEVVAERYDNLSRTAAIWPFVRGYVELKVTREALEGTFYGINDTMTNRHLTEFDHFIIFK
ncbi:Nucleotide pyrophosphatase/phosphodiesterase, putative [Perkinsus marinus ATCC 50983]|uniref:Purple acid phosphatase n=1 Tax=Perkinsus marinus (strain ATCC 50983 / TXsc) TaxID=423536 RepID=C5LPE1_PERM5|nr:Nucleotide pyrophosphatase/phosphodiesterase, putative [Perkinsus marinus ATCC 50983]EER01403.1 Nucleotide pyrophosphatase/phosphodiesterase, putative [Perkinsus marinus ATCC 50983]|eukprot:XP_002768685.1 Nucleotide pyrophosphatase/phosphodiesterase, putative [Perkinsus marinus ATCC 50983]